MALGLLGVLVCLTMGCSERAAAPVPPQPQAQAETNAANRPSTVETAIDGLTGRAAVRDGRRAQDKIRAISAERNADLNEAQDMQK
jgi:hypothetical protein